MATGISPLSGAGRAPWLGSRHHVKVLNLCLESRGSSSGMNAGPCVRTGGGKGWLACLRKDKAQGQQEVSQARRQKVLACCLFL